MSNSGTNSQGNDYTAHEGGAYEYENQDGSRYENDGDGHGRYESPPDGTESSGGQAYETTYDYNEAITNYPTRNNA